MKSNSTRSLAAFGIEPPSSGQTPEERELAAMIDEVSAVLAADHAAPLQPRASTLKIIHQRIQPLQASSSSVPWFAWLGWAAAAAIALFFGLRSPQLRSGDAGLTQMSGSAHPAKEKAAVIGTTSTQAEAADSRPEQAPPQIAEKAVAQSMAAPEALSLRDEVNTLRAQVSSLLKRDAERVTAVENMAWPVVIRMRKPGVDEQPTESVLRSLLSPQQLAMNQLNSSKNLSTPSAEAISPPVASVEGVEAPAIKTPDFGANEVGSDRAIPVPEVSGGGGAIVSGAEVATDQQLANDEAPQAAETIVDTLPSAIPVYDPARDQGQLLLSNLENPTPGQAYYLWVQVENSDSPQLVGALPENINTSSDAFEFKLGTTGVIPQSFRITQGKANQPLLPSAANTVLQGP